MKRNPSYLIINTYIPSFAIMGMTIVTLYLREDIHFATTIKLVLTSILCLFTTIQGSVSNMPKTAYLKLIDYWNLLALGVTLANFFIIVFWEIIGHKKEGKTWKETKDCMRVTLPLITVIGISVYWILTGMLYFEFL